MGLWLKAELKRWWSVAHEGELITVKYIDLTYMIRAVTANATDNLHCTLLAHSAIHGVMAGYTGFVAGPINGNYAYIPMDEIAEIKNQVDTKDHKWAWEDNIAAPSIPVTTFLPALWTPSLTLSLTTGKVNLETTHMTAHIAMNPKLNHTKPGSIAKAQTKNRPLHPPKPILTDY
ncbi:hypothetical protein R6Q59_001794 [Mikania micrantha]